jgi:hypothetical protein
METIKIVVVEDSIVFSDAIRKVLNEQKRFPCDVVVLNPNRSEMPTFEEFHDEIVSHLGDGFANLVLMDNHLGDWKWKGAHLAPSFTHNLVAISTDKMPWAEFNFTGKTSIAYHNDETAKIALVEIILTVLKKIMPPGSIAE